MRERKTVDRWDIMTNWGYGWECECSEYTQQAARQTYKDYVDNAYGRYQVRIEKHREPKEVAV